MPGTKRRFEPGVIQQLLDQPYRFQFFQAVRLLTLWFRRKGVAPEHALSRRIKFDNRLSLGFAPSELEAVKTYPASVGKTETELAQALQADTLEHISLTPTFMGFLGSSGTLPYHYTERIAAHQMVARDGGPKAFLDAFSNRPIALLFEAWRKYRLELQYESTGSDGFLPLLLSLAGLGHPSLHQRLGKEGDDGVLDESIASYSAALRQKPASAAYMTRVLCEHFDVPIRIQQFVGCWYGVPASQQSALGSPNAVLGSTAMVGARVWQRDLRMGIKIGPLARADFEQFLPGAKASQALDKLLKLFTNHALEYEVQLILRAQDVQSVALNSQRSGGKLGWDTFVTSGPALQDRADVRYTLNAI